MTVRSYDPNGTTPPKVTQDVVLAGTAPDVAFIEQLLGNVRDFLKKVKTVSQAYLPAHGDNNQELFFKVVACLNNGVEQYLKQNSNWYLNVARGNNPNALASAIPYGPKDDDITPQGTPYSTPRHTTLVIHPAFQQEFMVGQVRKRLTEHGQSTSLLHELTHSLVGTKDVYATLDKENPYKFLKDMQRVGDNWKDVLTPDACKELASAGTNFKSATSQKQRRYSWMNAENWTRALMTGAYPNNEPAEFDFM